MPLELPGFYFDPERNRYFRIVEGGPERQPEPQASTSAGSTSTGTTSSGAARYTHAEVRKAKRARKEGHRKPPKWTSLVPSSMVSGITTPHEFSSRDRQLFDYLVHGPQASPHHWTASLQQDLQIGISIAGNTLQSYHTLNTSIARMGFCVRDSIAVLGSESGDIR